MQGYDGSFPYAFPNFIVFGESIKKQDLAWISNDTLVNLETNDTIKFTNSKNVNFLFKDEPAKMRDLNFYQNKSTTL